MFEGTDLSIAFSGTNNNTGNLFGGNGGMSMYDSTPSGMVQTPAGPKPLPTPPPQAPMPELTSSNISMTNTVGNDFNPQSAMYAQQSAKPVKLPPSNSFWDRMGEKKGEVAKLVIFALVILLAISLDRFVTHYLTQYFGQSFLTETQALLIRLAYPIMIILVIWLIKAM
jgi:hypothetical protein